MVKTIALRHAVLLLILLGSTSGYVWCAEEGNGTKPESKPRWKEKIRLALDRPVTLDVADTPLADVVAHLGEQAGITNVVVDTKALDDVRIESGTPITKRLKGIPLRSALELTLKDLDLTYVPRDGVLVITTPEEAETHLITRMFNGPLGSFPRDGIAPALLAVSAQQHGNVTNWTGPRASREDLVNRRFVEGGDLIVARVSGSTDFLAYSKNTGKWRKHTFAETLTAIPVVGKTVAAFSIGGREVMELVAVDRDGNWHPLPLKKPAATRCSPVISDHLAVYHVDGRAYAFSGITGRWGAVAAENPPRVSSDVAMIVTADEIAVFSARTGFWAVTRTTSDGG